MADFTGKQIIETPYTAYDHKEACVAEVLPLLQQLFDACERLGVPAFATVCVQQEITGNASFATKHLMASGPAVVPAELIACLSILQGNTAHAIQALEIDAERVQHQAFTRNLAADSVH